MKFRVLSFALALVGFTAAAGDLSSGYVFTDGEKNVTATKLNNQVANATINTSFYTGKSAQTNATSSDLFLLYSPTLSGFRKVTFGNMILNNTLLITSQNEDTAPATNDYVLVYDSSGGTYTKVPLSSLALPNTGLIGSLAVLSSNLLQGSTIPILQDGTNNQAAISLILQNWMLYSFTNLPSMTRAVTNEDQLLVWDSVGKTNAQLAVSGWFTNPPIASVYTNDDSILLWSSRTNATDGTNGRLYKLTIAGLYTNPPTTTVWGSNDTFVVWANNTNGPTGTNPSPVKVPAGKILPQTFMSAEYILPGAGAITNIAHGLPGTPQEVRWVLICKTTDASYAVGDELPANAFYDTGSAIGAFTFGGNATNVFFSQSDPPRVHSKSSPGSFTSITAANWRAKAYAAWSPY